MNKKLFNFSWIPEPLRKFDSSQESLLSRVTRTMLSTAKLQLKLIWHKHCSKTDISNQSNPLKKIVWLDLGEFSELIGLEGGFGKWQDHGLGLLRTILHQNKINTELVSVRTLSNLEELENALCGYDMLLMNVRSYTFIMARDAARLFKKVNPGGIVIIGGMHATVAPDEVESVSEFDKICKGAGERTIIDLVSNPDTFPRVFTGKGARSMAEWPPIDRCLWPKPRGMLLPLAYQWPLEPECGWGPGPVATVLTSRVCPWRCSFCNENSFIKAMGRRSVDAVIDELNDLDNKFGVGSVVIHDSMFFQNPSWLREWLDKYPRRANKLWPYWAAARADTVRQWPDLFEALVKETNWNTISIGFESGSDPILRVLNKESTAEDNNFAIDLVNRIGDEMEAKGRKPPHFWSNIMLGVPGETRDDAFKTMAMVKRMKRASNSIAFFAPYPGSVLGYQLIAEGKSLMTKENYHRFPNDEKVKGIEYDFYRDLVAGKYEQYVLKATLTENPSKGSKDTDTGKTVTGSRL